MQMKIFYGFKLKRFNDANKDINGCKLKGLVMQIKIFTEY